MRCRGDFVFKSLRRRNAGTFVNDAGQSITYNECYILTVDEDTDNGIVSRKLRFPCTNTNLAQKLQNLEPYTKISLLFDVALYDNGSRVLVIDLLED